MLAASRHYQALFAGDQSYEADVAGMRLSECIEYLIAFVEAHAKESK